MENLNTEIKCKGISLSCSALDIITFDKMVEMAKKYFENDEVEELIVAQRQFNINKHSQIFTRYFEKNYRTVSDKRVKDGNITFPYGY